MCIRDRYYESRNQGCIINSSTFYRVLGLLTFLAEKLGCYKTTLNCTDDVALFCEKMKYMHEPGQNFMLCHVTPTISTSPSSGNTDETS